MPTTIKLDPPVYRLLRVFSERAHAESFKNGELYLNTVRHFKRSLDEGAHRSDRFEAAARVMPSGSITSLTVGAVEIPGHKLGTFQLGYRRDELANIYCLYGWRGGPHFDSLEEARQQLRIPPEIAGLGEHLAVIKEWDAFLNRVIDAAHESHLEAEFDQVCYFDESIYQEFERPLFWKSLRYAHQNELRLVLRRNELIDEPLRLRVGDLSDLVELTTIKDFNASIQIDWAEPTDSCSQLNSG